MIRLRFLGLFQTHKNTQKHTFGTVPTHFWNSPNTLLEQSQHTSGTVPTHSGTVPNTRNIFDRIFEMHEFGVVGRPKNIFFNILIQSNIPEQSGSIGTRVEQYGFSLLSGLNWITLKEARPRMLPYDEKISKKSISGICSKIA